jgi:hypothetical protein
MKKDVIDRQQLDSWKFQAHNSVFSPSGYYKLMFTGLQVCMVFKKLWKSKGLHKQKSFIWLLLVDGLCTRDMMERRRWHSGVDFAVCNTQQRESREHLLFNCPFAINVWHRLGIV